MLRVEPGWTLFETLSGTQVNLPEVGLTSFQGVPFESFNFRGGHLSDFGRGIEQASTSRVDSIAKRLLPAVTQEVGSTVTIPVELVGLQLRSENPVGGPFGDQHVFITLQSARGGPQTLGVMAIQFVNETGGTFNTVFQVYFDLRVGRIDSQPMSQAVKSFVGHATSWQRVPPANSLLISKVNSDLSVSEPAGTFFPVEILVESTSADRHLARLATDPIKAGVQA